eukprot:356991-Prymnesium_polylepis.1
MALLCLAYYRCRQPRSRNTLQLHPAAPIKSQTERSSFTISAAVAATILVLHRLKTTPTMCVTKPSFSPLARSAQNEARVERRLFCSPIVAPPAENRVCAF